MLNFELADILRRNGYTQSRFARRIGINERTVRRWISGNLPVPRYVDVLFNSWRRNRKISLTIAGRAEIDAELEVWEGGMRCVTTGALIEHERVALIEWAMRRYPDTQHCMSRSFSAVRADDDQEFRARLEIIDRGFHTTAAGHYGLNDKAITNWSARDATEMHNFLDGKIEAPPHAIRCVDSVSITLEQLNDDDDDAHDFDATFGCQIASVTY